MKKLNITKKQYDESKYFNQKYGALKFVSESGKLYKTDKGVVIALESGVEPTNESLSDIGKAIGDTAKDWAGKVKNGAKKAAKAIGDAIKGPFRKGDHITLSGDAGEVEATITDGSIGGKEYTVILQRNLDESTEDETNDDEKSTEVLGDVLAGLIDAVKDVAEKNGIDLPGDAGEGSDDEEKDDDEKDDADDDAEDDEKDDDEKDDDDLLRDGELELTDEGDEECRDGECGAVKKECGATQCECGGKKPAFKESVRRHRARLVREAIQRRAKARKIRESIERRARARKVMESIRQRRRAKVMESLRKRRAARKVMESIRRRRAAKRVMESRRAK